jgi:ppGpp synthetase/RelA/SpoT-type nucleotidyltranferase
MASKSSTKKKVASAPRKKAVAASEKKAVATPRRKAVVDPGVVIDECMKVFEENQKSLTVALQQITLYLNSSILLAPHMHTLKTRLKSSKSLRDKLNRKLAKLQPGEQFPIIPTNLFEKINDLVGLRILHLYRGQVQLIDQAIREIANEQDLRLVQVFARTWDDRSRQFFAGIGIATELSPTMYTSIHYVLAWGRNVKTCEIQVRTLSEEVWGEIDHSINYPHPTTDVACAGQLETLAAAVMNVTANVDSIVRTVAELKRRGSA